MPARREAGEYCLKQVNPVSWPPFCVSHGHDLYLRSQLSLDDRKGIPIQHGAVGSVKVQRIKTWPRLHAIQDRKYLFKKTIGCLQA
jgi:hypothetical protein